MFVYYDTHRRSKDSTLFLKFYQSLIDKYSLNFIVDMWALSIFHVITRHDAKPHSQAINNNVFVVKTKQSWPLVELIDLVFNVLDGVHATLYVRGFLNSDCPGEFFLKKTIHSLIRIISERYPNQLFSCIVKDFTDVIKPSSQLELKKFLERVKNPEKLSATPRQPAYKKLTVVELCCDFSSFMGLTFWVFRDSPKIYSRNTTHVVHGICWLLGYRLLVQKKTKENSEITASFCEQIQYLQEVAMHLCIDMVGITEKLMFQDYETMLEDFYKELKELKFKELPDNNITNLISFFTKRKVVAQNKNQSSKNKIILSFQELHKNISTESKSFGSEIFSFISSFENISSKKIRLSHWEYTQAQHFISIAQNFLAKIRLLHNTISFLVHLKLWNVDKLYYSIYADFRGRIYYKSSFSPQNYWYYRFLFHFGDIENYQTFSDLNLVPDEWITDTAKKHLKALKITDSNLYSVFCSIGVLFKTKYTNTETGMIKVSDLIEHGLNLYIKYKECGLAEFLGNSIKTKIKVELLYYFNIIDKHLSGVFKAFYLQKDTTCSMAQHAGKLLGYKKESLKFLNLDNLEYLCDTYQIYINHLKAWIADFEFKLIEGTEKAYIINALNRDLLKNLIMTSEYGVTHHTAWREYIQVVKDLDSDNELKSLLLNKEVFNCIFGFFQTNALDCVFYQQTKKEWLDKFLLKNPAFFEIGGIKIPVNYYIKHYKSAYYRVKGAPERERLTALLPLHVNEHRKYDIDLKKVASATYVNSVHSLDADYLRSIVFLCSAKGIPIITIHDGFCIPYFRETALRSIANTCFFNNITKDGHYGTSEFFITSTTILI